MFLGLIANILPFIFNRSLCLENTKKILFLIATQTPLGRIQVMTKTDLPTFCSLEKHFHLVSALVCSGRCSWILCRFQWCRLWCANLESVFILFTLPATELLTLTRAKFYLRFRIEVRILIWGGFAFSDTLAMFRGILLVMTGELLLWSGWQNPGMLEIYYIAQGILLLRSNIDDANMEKL